MTGQIVELPIAAVVFVGSHFLLSSTGLRGRLVDRLGEGPFRAVYSALALLLLIWIAVAYREAPRVDLWIPPPLIIIVPLVVMPIALLLLVGGLTQPNPTAVAPGRHFAPERPAPGVLAITRHPVLWAIGLWALAHLIANGDSASVVLFGSLAFLALYGTRLIDDKKRRDWPAEDWQRFSAATSNLPFAALASSRNQWRLGEIGWWRLILAGVLYVLLIALHPVVFGVRVVVDL
jgi:uncharacterized membrane protein